MVPPDRGSETTAGRSVLQPVQPPEFCAAVHRLCRNPRPRLDPDRLRRVNIHDITTNRLAWRRVGWRQFSENDRVSGAAGILTRRYATDSISRIHAHPFCFAGSITYERRIYARYKIRTRT